VAQPAERVASTRVTGIVFVDQNANGRRDPGEAGVSGVPVSDQISVVATDGSGRFSLDAAGYGLIFVSAPTDYHVRGPFWRSAVAGADLEIPLVAAPPTQAFTFVHASDTHISEATVDRTRRLRFLVDSLRPAFVLITGDLIRDALRVSEGEARRLFELFRTEIAAFPVPVFVVPGNHEIFAIERHRSLVSPEHPFYGKRLYRSMLGPNYYSFDWGGVHFVGLDTADYFDLWYYGQVDSLQLEWLNRDVGRLAPGTPVVTFNHIPLVSGAQSIDGYDEESVAPTLIRLNGRSRFRHTVGNNEAVIGALGSRLEIALGGHFHRREFLRYETASGTRRFAQTGAVVGPVRGRGLLGLRSGITWYRVSDRRVDDGTFIPLDP
jgi:3',5'-cyclic AMP phosphodiesterase CpdA